MSQQYVVSTLAGGGPPTTPVNAKSASIYPATGIAADSAGNIFLNSQNCVLKVSADGMLTRVAGTGRTAFSGDGGPATNAQLSEGGGLALDSAGNLYVADPWNYRVRRISAGGIITTVAGSGAGNGPKGDGGPAVNAFVTTDSFALDGEGNLFILDIAFGLFVRKVSQDASGNRFIPNAGDNVVRKVLPNGTLTTVAGDTSNVFNGGGQPATHAALYYPRGITFDNAGNLFIADSANNRVRRVSKDGIITTVVGNGTAGFSGVLAPD